MNTHHPAPKQQPAASPDFGPTLFDHNPSRGELPELVPPNFVDPTAVVEHVFPRPDLTTASRDRGSQQRMTDYLHERLEPSPEVGREIRGVVPDGYGTRTRWHHDGWLFKLTPKRALAATVMASALATGTVNSDAIGHNVTTVAEDVGDEVRQFDFWRQHGSGRPDVTITHQPVTITTHYDTMLNGETQNASGESTADTASIDGLVDRITGDIQGKPGTLLVKVAVEAVGTASDEWAAGDGSIGKPDAGNKKLAEQRAEVAAKAVVGELKERGVVVQSVRSSAFEAVLPRKTKAELTEAAQKAGFPTLRAAITAVDSGEKVEPGLEGQIRKYLTQRRGTAIRVDVESLQTTTSQKPDEHIPGIHPPENPDRDYQGIWPILFPVLPLPRFRRSREVFGKVREIVFRSVGRPEWLHLYPEALTENEELKRHAAFYTRKYNHLLRDNRIASVERMDYIGHDGAERTVRMCFVDHEPSDEARKKFREVMATMANAQEGSIGDTTQLITVFPSHNAGTAHKNPKRIALGIDKQHEKSTLGFNLPLLGLIELHMPVTGTREQLAEFYGGLWTLAHEMSHSLDVKPQPVELVRLIDGSYVSRDPWADAFAAVDKQLADLPSSRPELIEYDIVRQVRDRNGTIRAVTERVREGDTRLSEAVSVQIVGHKPTEYGSSHSVEHLAETGAAAVSGIDIPFEESGTNVPAYDDFNFAKGFAPAKESLRAFAERSGLGLEDFRQLDALRVRFTTTSVRDDPVLHEIAERVRRTSVPAESDMIRVAGWVIDRALHESKP